MAQQIKITQTSNADMNIGVPKTLTAVEWLEEQLNKWSDGRFYLPPHLFEKAKEMEKEQIIDAWEDGKGSFSTRQPELYYNETYGK